MGSSTLRFRLSSPWTKLWGPALVFGVGCQYVDVREFDDTIDTGGTHPGAYDGSPDTLKEDGAKGSGDDETATTTVPVIVGGTATAVLGAGLVLQNNGKDDLSIASSGAFEFETSLFTGEAYDVTVRTQPTAPSQTCTVSNGKGVAKESDVANVKVSCVTNTYKVGGSVVGLVGQGLKLLNNGGNELSVDGATFAFVSPVPSGGNYNVTIQSQPSGQTCVVSGGIGTIVAGDVSSVVVNCQDNSHTIGGTVNGLAGTLVLQNNGGNDRVLTSNGSFAFSLPILSGQPYNVTVKTAPQSPISQTCSVTNGSGTVGSSNVTNIVVTCSENEYTIGGAVSGLAGSGLVLQNKGTNNLSVSSNGSFTFSNKVPSGGDYAVSVFTQPSNQSCQVTGGAGTVGASNITSVAVSCATTIALSQNFDGVSAPSLPSGWSTSVLSSGSFTPWRTNSSTRWSTPNSAYLNEYSSTSDIVLVSPSFVVGSSSAELSFRNKWNLEHRYDGGVLEISISGGSYRDIISEGGVFVSNGYNYRLYNDTETPLAGRDAWTGSGPSNFVNTVVRLPSSASGKSVRLRWRLATDYSVRVDGWWIDDIVVKN